MKKIFFGIVLTIFSVSHVIGQENGFYGFKVKTIDGAEFDFAQLKGKKVMIVNTASKCGFTPQYEDLQKLFEEYGGDDFVILGFPANNFRSQEPGTDSEIKSFCTENYGVSFPMMSKISVKGDDIHPLYQWLTRKDLNGVEDSEVSWNFQKYMVDENGNLVKYLKPMKNPMSKEVLSWLEE